MVVPLSLALMGLGGCNPYERWTGDEFNAGPVDAQTFPPAYLGTDAVRQRAGSGFFAASSASVGGAQVEYFLFPFSTTQLELDDPLAAASSKEAPKPSAYVFNNGCKAPEGYSYDLARDAVDYSQQGVIFTQLPSATYAPGVAATWSYVPIVARVPVTPTDTTCQTIKSETALVKRAGNEVGVVLTDPAPATGKQVGVSDGTLLAHAIIEPGAAVFHADGETPATGVGLQKWGWYNQYLLAYLDGGEIPTAGGRLVTQRLFVPRSEVTLTDAQGNTSNEAVAAGQGFDVLTAQRGQPDYSPVCEVWTYDAGGPLTPEQLPKSVADIEANYNATLAKPTAGDPYVYCLQLDTRAE
ncbi:hypothetical protein BON30_20745 [Cystobacter ferrugineus]|uniref:Uncharacterized protein n=2 Tax=Cystobacter ferrugineus TaxID=83449 RepID=A0A1L9B8Y5_9BACT|nr:hypothetical protein BON30_20745 [Cystobacter ferrugineus]